MTLDLTHTLVLKHDLTCSGWAVPSLVWRRTSAIPAAPGLWGAVWRSRFRARSGSFVGWEHDCCQDDSFWDKSSLTWITFNSRKTKDKTFITLILLHLFLLQTNLFINSCLSASSETRYTVSSLNHFWNNTHAQLTRLSTSTCSWIWWIFAAWFVVYFNDRNYLLT